MLAGVLATDGRHGGARLLCGREVVGGADALRAGVGQGGLHEVKSDPADV